MGRISRNDAVLNDKDWASACAPEHDPKAKFLDFDAKGSNLQSSRELFLLQQQQRRERGEDNGKGSKKNRSRSKKKKRKKSSSSSSSSSSHKKKKRKETPKEPAKEK